MHQTTACRTGSIATPEGYTSFTPYRQLEADLKAVGFDVLVFIPSVEEDEDRITCGNAILATRSYKYEEMT
jgi:23S rRNA (adenine2503-C2)-methyltransferase